MLELGVVNPTTSALQKWVIYLDYVLRGYFQYLKWNALQNIVESVYLYLLTKKDRHISNFLKSWKIWNVSKKKAIWEKMYRADDHKWDVWSRIMIAGNKSQYFFPNL